MKVLYTMLFLSSVATQVNAQQIQGDFDADWNKCTPWDSKNNTTPKGTEPQGWHISNVVLAGEVGKKVTGKDQQGYAVQLTNLSTMGQKIPGYLSLGTPWATAEVKIGLNTKVNNADGGTFGGKAFTFHPDAISYDYVRDNSHGAENATVTAYLWKGTWTQESVPGNTSIGGTATKTTMTNRDRNVLGMQYTPTGGNITKTDDAMLVASLNDTITASTEGAWASRTAEFHYTTDSIAPVENVNVIFAATDFFGDRNGIVGKNSLTVDNVRFVYYHALSALTATDNNGNDVELNFQPDVYNYTVNSTYDEYWTEVSYTKKGFGATVEAGYDEETARYIITVKGEDYDKETNPEAVSTYTIQYVKEAPTLTSLSVGGHEFIKLGVADTTFAATGRYCADELSLKASSEDADVESYYDEKTGVLTVKVSEPLAPSTTYTVTFAGESKTPVYQIPNGDFENWNADQTALTGSWNSFNTACGTWANFAQMSPMPVRIDGHNGNGVRIVSKDLYIAYANGNLTTGRINMGNTNPADSTNFNFTDRTDKDANLPFAGMPDAFEVYARFAPGKAKAADTPLQGRVQLIMHGDAAYHDPELAGQADSKIASAAVLIPQTEEWTKFTGTFNYNTEVLPGEVYLLASATTNPVPGASKDDQLDLDDLHLIYYHALSAITLDGKLLDGFDTEKTDYTVTGNISELWDRIEYVKKGIGATVTTFQNFEEGTMQIEVKGNDYEADKESVTTYTIHFEPNATGIGTIGAEQTEGKEVYTLGGVRVNGRPAAGIYIVNGKKTYVK